MARYRGFYEREQDDNWIIEFTSLSSWEAFQSIAETMSRQRHATVLKRYDGPDARRWILEIDHVKLDLYHDDMGINWLVAPKSSKELARQICQDVISDLDRANSCDSGNL